MVADVISAKADLRIAPEKALRFFHHVGDIFTLCQRESTRSRVLAGVDHNDFSKLKSFIKQIQYHLAKAEEVYQEALEALKELQKSSLDAAEECKKYAEDARFKKNTTRAVGGAVTGTTLAAEWQVVLQHLL